MAKFTTEEIVSKDRWEQFVVGHPEANFLQSWNYGDFYKNLGRKLYRLGFFRHGKLVGVALVIKESAKRGTYLTVTGGPIIDWGDSQLIKYITNYLRRLCRDVKAIFVRIRPQLIENAEYSQRMNQIGWKKAPVNLEAELTLLLDLTKSEDELLGEMKKSTRYEIRKSEKMEISTMMSMDLKEVKKFSEYQEMLGEKQGFVPFSYDFLHEQFKAFLGDDQVTLVNAYKDGKLLASAYIIFYNGKAAYHYGITTPENKRLPGAYACQWQVIKEAKNRGMKTYNLWGGLMPKNKSDHRYRGVDLFKRGFGGKEIQYLPAHDLPVSWKYWVVRCFEWMRKKERGL